MNPLLLCILIGFVLGLGCSSLGNHIVKKHGYDGVILIEDNDSDNPKWHLNVHTDPEEIPNKKCILLQVHVQK